MNHQEPTTVTAFSLADVWMEREQLRAELAAARTAAHAWKRAAKFWYFAQPDDDGEWERWQEYRYRRELFKPVTLED